MAIGTKLSSARRQLTSRLGSALLAPVVRRDIGRRGPRIPDTSPFAVYFADTPDAIYQLEQWRPALLRLTKAGTPVTLLVTNAQSAHQLLKLGGLPVCLCSGSAAVEEFVDKHEVQVLFYVNNNQANFTSLRINGVAHVHLSHGESEKSSMVSNQLKAYDRAFIAGPAARDRIITHVRGIDPSHLVEIGRPQLDLPSASSQEASGQTVVLYAPTWEGDSTSMAYSSLADRGPDLLRLLAADDRLRLNFRPHPKTGTRSRDHAMALHHIHRLLGQPSKYRAWAGQTIPFPDPISDLSRADVVVTDISAMAMDAVGLNKPTVILTTTAGAMTGAARGLASAVPTWTEIPPDAVQQLLDLARRGASEQQQRFRERVFGSDDRGTGTAQFINAAQALLSPPPPEPSGVP